MKWKKSDAGVEMVIAVMMVVKTHGSPERQAVRPEPKAGQNRNRR